MSAGELIIVALRLTIPLLILRRPLVGGIVAMVLDALDVVLIEAIGLGGFGNHYAELDKALDSYYLTLELIVALRWTSAWARLPAVLLFVYRGMGVIAFEITDLRVMLFIFPNLFENWWLYCVVVARFWPRLYPSSWRSTIITLVLLLIPKMGQEYLLHYREAQPWDWLKENMLHTG
jgi:hypothetical protein